MEAGMNDTTDNSNCNGGDGRGYITLSDGLVRRSAEVGDPAFRIFCILRTFANAAGECWPGEITLAGIVGCSVRHVGRAIRTLSKAGWIQVKRRQQQPNLYTIAADSRSDTGVLSGIPDRTKSVVQIGQKLHSRSDTGVPRTIPSSNHTQEPKRARKRTKFQPPPKEEVIAFWKSEALARDPVEYWQYRTDNEWVKASGYPVANWKLDARSWAKNPNTFHGSNRNGSRTHIDCRNGPNVVHPDDRGKAGPGGF
jgi:hypothetical protein